jgi:hypothetical protein
MLKASQQQAQKPDRQAQLLRMGEAFRAAAAGADWDQLGEQARTLAPRLQALAARGPWSAAERGALQRLRTEYVDAASAVAESAQVLASRLEELRTNKEGWIAYAMHSETENGTSQA